MKKTTKTEKTATKAEPKLKKIKIRSGVKAGDPCNNKHVRY